MNLRFTTNYKSLEPFEWANVPMFTIITGTNGSGKTQLLELIFNTLVPQPQHQPFMPPNPTIEISGVIYDKGEVSFLKSEWILANTSPINHGNLDQELRNLYNQFTQPQNTQYNPKLDYLMNQTSKRMGKARNQHTPIEDFIKNFSADYIQDDTQITHQIARIFVDYNISLLEKTAEKIKEVDIVTEIGPKPWILLNDIMKEAGLPFAFNSPTPFKIKEHFKLSITDTLRNKVIEFESLSSGEKVLISLVFFLYNSQEKKYFPKFLLLDEPDAHLHPSMAKQFLDVINNVLVKKNNIRVMMTSHSPSTVALAPDESLFEMSRFAPRIMKSISKNKTISLLTSGLVIVGQGTKYYLVEDKADVDFYQETYSFLLSQNHVSGTIPLVFIPASTTNKSGGKTVVAEWVNKLSASGLEDVIRGIIDKDHGNPPSQGIYIINRYSFENYLLDPIIVYAALMDKDHHPKLPNIPLGLGEEYKLKGLTEIQLQEIATTIHSKVEPLIENHSTFKTNFKPEEKDLIEIELLTGQKLHYPKWLLQRRGKTVLNEIYNPFFNTDINPASLMKAFKKIHILPKEMRNFIENLEK